MMILFQTELTLARGMLYNPRWTWHAAEALNEEAVYAPQYMRSSRALRDLPIPKILLFRPQNNGTVRQKRPCIRLQDGPAG
jgi:hypothetical protein